MSLHERIAAELAKWEAHAAADHRMGWSTEYSDLVLTWVPAARRVLQRHAALPESVATPIGSVVVCRTCSDLDDRNTLLRVVGYPCWEIRDLAASLGLEVDD